MKHAVLTGAATKKNKKDQSEKHHQLRKYFSLALLPAHMMKPALTELNAETKAVYGNDFDNFIAYVEKRCNKPEVISVFRRHKRTDNTSERTHRAYKVLFGVHPKPGHFMGKSRHYFNNNRH